jgi:acetolactate synthase-1/2/3 large subunit
MAMTGGQLLAAGLLRHNVDALFMIPGIQLDWAVNALAQEEQIRLFVPRHEQSTTYMADGYHRVSGKPGIAMVVPGPGMLNAAAGLATAYGANSKVLLLSGNIHSSAIGRSLGLLHEIEGQSEILGALTKWNHRVTSTQEIGAVVDRAFVEMNTGRPRPVGIEISHDLLQAKSTNGATDGLSNDYQAVTAPVGGRWCALCRRHDKSARSGGKARCTGGHE